MSAQTDERGLPEGESSRSAGGSLMRVHPAVLLVILALTVPLVVELRTVLAWVGVELTIVQSLVVGAVVIGAIVAWAVYPPRDGNGSGASG